MRMIMPTVVVALFPVLVARPAPEKKPPAMKDVMVVFHNDVLDDVDQFVRMFFTREQVIRVASKMKDFEKRNKNFMTWVRSLKPGFHVYSEGVPDGMQLVTRLLLAEPGWICCGPFRQFVRTSELKVSGPTKEQLDKMKRIGTPLSNKYFQMKFLDQTNRIWIHEK